MNQIQIKELERIISHNHSNMTGMVVLKDGKICYENYFNQCNAASTVHVYSVTKSIISILIGIALNKGYIKSTGQKILEFFPDYPVKKGEKTIRNVTLEQLLTMTAPYKFKFAPYIRYFRSHDHIQFTLDLLGGRKQGNNFHYTPLIGPDILSGILTKVSGQSVFDFAKQNLFLPLGISVECSVVFGSAKEQMEFNQAIDISAWAADGAGVNTAGWGLTLTAGDMAKIGQLYLNGGIWDGRQIVSKGWIDESTREHSRWEKMNLAYGYLWWIIDAEKGIYAAMGDGGNIIYVNTGKNLVVASSALFEKKAADRIDLIQGYIEPMFES